MTTLQWKLIGGAVLALLVGVFVASWLARGREIDRLNDWQDTVVLAATQATVEPDKNGKRKHLDPGAVPAAVAALRRTADNAESTLAAIDQVALKDKAIQRQLDEQLAAILMGQDRAAAGSSATIRDLLQRRASGDPAQDCKVMEQDSNTPWDGWRN